MAKISTQQLIDEYLDSLRETKTEAQVTNIQKQMSRPELFEYEKKIGKELLDMNVDELFDMLRTFKGKTGFQLSASSFKTLIVFYRQAFDLYIERHEPIRNPWMDKRMRGIAVCNELKTFSPRLTTEIMEQMINKLYEVFDSDRAEYIECIMRLFYCGFANTEEIATLKEANIDFKRHTVRMGGRIVNLDERTLNTLMDVHNMEVMRGWRKEYLMASWHDSYFKFPIFKNELATFDERELSRVTCIITRMVSTRLRTRLGYDINYRQLYLLGFYDHLVRTYGLERTREMLLSVRDRESYADLTNAARYYGFVFDSTSQVKYMMRPYVE